MSRDDLFLFDGGGVVTCEGEWAAEARLCEPGTTRLELLVFGPEAHVAVTSCCSPDICQ